MTRLPPEIEARRTVEDEALRLGAELAKAQSQVEALKERIVDGMERARAVKLPIEHYAELVGMKRQELYRRLSLRD